MIYAPLAQLVEQLTLNQEVRGSIPRWCTKIKNSRFKVEYNYDKLLGYQEEYYDHHIFWRKKYLNIEPHGKKEKIAIEQYVANRQPGRKKDEEYDTGIYQKIQPKVITYDTSDKKEYFTTKLENEKIKNQILCNK